MGYPSKRQGPLRLQELDEPHIVLSSFKKSERSQKRLTARFNAEFAEKIRVGRYQLSLWTGKVLEARRRLTVG